jgi:hypothetical protein
MKVNVKLDLTPEEARHLMGLPDLAPVHEALIAQMQDALKNGISADMMTSMVRNWSPLGEGGMKLWQGLLDQVGNVAEGAKRPRD